MFEEVLPRLVNEPDVKLQRRLVGSKNGRLNASVLDCPARMIARPATAMPHPLRGSLSLSLFSPAAFSIAISVCLKGQIESGILKAILVTGIFFNTLLNHVGKLFLFLGAKLLQVLIHHIPHPCP